MKTPLRIDEETGRPVDFPLYSVGGLILKNDSVAIVTQNDGHTQSFPKGHVKPGEVHIRGAFREIEEEIGVPKNELRLIRELGTYSRNTQTGIGIEDITRPKLIRLWQFETDFEGKLTPRDVENPSARWIHVDKVHQELLHPKDIDFYLRQRELGYF